MATKWPITSTAPLLVLARRAIRLRLLPKCAKPSVVQNHRHGWRACRPVGIPPTCPIHGVRRQTPLH